MSNNNVKIITLKKKFVESTKLKCHGVRLSDVINQTQYLIGLIIL